MMRARAHVPAELREAWAEKQDVIVSHDGTRIDFHGGGKYWWEPKHLTGHELKRVTDTIVVSLLHDKVTSINDSLCSNLTDQSIKAIAKGCPELKELYVSHIHNLTDESIKAIANGCPQLKELHVDFCEKLADESIKAIAQGCPELKELNVEYCRNLTDDSIKAIAKGCPELKQLQVWGITNLTDESIKAIAKGCPELKELNAGDCSKLTHESIKAIAKGCPELKELNVYNVENLTDDAIKAVASGCPELKELDVFHITNLTGESIKAIAEGCPELVKLDISWCRMNDSSIKAILEGCPGLMRLNANNCGLRSLPDDLGHRLPHLQFLNMYDNKLTTLPPSIVKLKNLHYLNVENNPLQSPPYEIATQGLDAIERYFDELEKGSTVSKLLKVVLVGDGEAGKTSLRNALAGRPKPRQKDRTIHLDIEKITLTEDLDINVYDCGGQEEYLATQLPYLTGLALYIVVVDAQYATDEYAGALEDKLHRFLVVLQNRVPGAVVLPILTKVDTVEDAETRCRWLENTIEKWLRNTLEAVCGGLPDSSSECSHSPAPPLASRAHANAVRTPDEGPFMPLCVQWPPLAVSVADTNEVEDVRDSVRGVRDRIIALTKHNPPLLRGVGQQIPSTYRAVLKLFGSIAEFGDNDLASEALRNDTAHALGETSKLSPEGTYRPKDEIENLWNTIRNESDESVKDTVFDDATQLWEAQGLIFVDAGLVILQPDFITKIVKPLVDHRYDEEHEYEHFEDVAAQFLQSTSSRDNDAYNQLIDALDTFRESGEFDCSDESLFLPFLWRDTGLAKSHYDQVLHMLAKSGVILKVDRDAGEKRTVVVVPFRLPLNPDKAKFELVWPESLPSKKRELKLQFEPRSGLPTGLAERFITNVHGLGTSLYSWRHGVVVKDSAGYSALAERRENVLEFSVRFKTHSNADAAWKALCDAQQLLAAQRENRFPGLYYKVCFFCEACCRTKRRTVATRIFDEKKKRCVFRACGHSFDLDAKGKCSDSPIIYQFDAPVSNSQIVAIAEGDAINGPRRGWSRRASRQNNAPNGQGRSSRSNSHGSSESPNR